MPGFKIINNASEITLNNRWAAATKFNSKDRLVDKKGHKVSSRYKGSLYRIIEKKERSFSNIERIGRGLLGIVAVICTLCLALFSKSIRHLFTKSKENIRFGILAPGSEQVSLPLSPLFEVPEEIIQTYFKFLSIRELLRLSCVNKLFSDRVKVALNFRAIEYGKKSSDIVPPTMYIQNLFDKVSYIHKHATDKSFIVYRENSRHLDCEKTLGKIGGIAGLLFVFVGMRYYENVKWLLEKGIDPNLKNSEGQTPLIYLKDRWRWRTEEKNYLDILRLLLESKADPNISDNMGRTALTYYSSPEAMTLLCQSKGNVNYQAAKKVDLLHPIGQTPLHLAVLKEEIETVRVLLANGANPNIRNNYGQTPLFCSIFSYNFKGNRISIIQELLDHHCDPNIPDNDGYTTLYQHVDAYSHDIVELLCRYEANVNYQIKNGNTALHLAVEQSCSKAVKILLQNKADLTIKNTAGETPIDIAERKKSLEIQLILKSAGH